MATSPVRKWAFTKERRLLDASAYQPVFKSPNTKVSNAYFLLLAKKSDLPHARLGIVVAKKSVRLAVKRNRIKRIMRETFRQYETLPTTDIVILARPAINQLDKQQLQQALSEGFAKLKKKID